MATFVNSSHSHKSKPLTLSPSTHSVFNKSQIVCSNKITDGVPVAFSISTFLPKEMLSVERKLEQQFPYSHQTSSVLHPISNESFGKPSFEINSSPWTSNSAPYWQNLTSKHSIKLPHLTTQNINGKPLKYHEWINKFFASYTATLVLLTHILSPIWKMKLPEKQKTSSKHIRAILLTIAQL